MTENIIIVAAGLAVFLVAEAIYYLFAYSGQKRRMELRRRLQTAGGGARTGLLRERKLARSATLAKMLEPLPGVMELNRLLLRTDLNLTVASLLGLSLLSAVGLAVVAVVATGGNALAALLGLPLGFLVPVLLVRQARVRRSRKISEQLPEALDMMVRALRAGHGVGSGFRLVATEMPEPIAVEFARCFEEQNVGVSLRESVQNLTKRVPDNLDLKIFAVSVVIQHETGGNLIEILEQIGATVRDRYKFFGKLRALTAEARLSGTVLGLLPIVCLIAVSLMNPGYLDPMVQDPLGRMLGFTGLGLWLVGLVWMRRLGQVEY